MATFEIIGDGISLDVAQSSKLTTEFVATTFNEDAVFAGSFSYPITFPFTPKNIAYFGHSHHLENRGARVRKEVTIILFGLSWKTAFLTYDVTRSGYEGALTVDNGTVAQKLREITVADVFVNKEQGKVSFQGIPLGADSSEVVANMLGANLPGSNNGFCWPTVKNTNILGEQAEEKFQLINNFENMSRVGDEVFYSPHFYHTWLIKQVCSFLGYQARGSYLDDDFIKSIIVYNTGIRTGKDFKTDRVVNPAYHLPAVSISEYIKGIRNDHRVMIYFDSLTKIAHFELSSVVLNSRERLDISETIHDDSLEIKQQTEASFKLLTRIDDSDDLYKSIKYELSVTVGYDVTRAKDLQLFFGKPFTGLTSLDGMDGVVLPTAQQTCNLYSLDYEEKDSVYNAGNVYGKNGFAFRLLSYKGIKSVREGVQYNLPFATSSNSGNLNEMYTRSLDQGGATGMVTQMTLPYYQFYCLSEKVTVSAEMNVLQFFNLSPLQKIVIADRTQAKVESFLDKIVFESREQGSKKSIIGKITCYPNYAILGGAQNINVIVGQAETSTPEETIYAKLFTKRIRMETGSDGFMSRIVYDLNLSFYSDQGGAFAVSVENIPYNIEIKKYNKNLTEVLGSSNITGVASGSTHYAGEYVQRDFDDGWSWQKPYAIAPDGEFLVIGNYVLTGDRWISYS